MVHKHLGGLLRLKHLFVVFCQTKGFYDTLTDGDEDLIEPTDMSATPNADDQAKHHDRELLVYQN